MQLSGRKLSLPRCVIDMNRNTLATMYGTSATLYSLERGQNSPLSYSRRMGTSMHGSINPKGEGDTSYSMTPIWMLPFVRHSHES